MYKRIGLILSLISVTGVGFAVAVAMTGGALSIYFGKLVGISSRIIGGEYAAVSSLGESIGTTRMAGGDYALESTVGAFASAKLENDLTKAHCYPNPYKPNSGLGHTKITFSRLTTHTKLRVYSIAGELVRSTEEDTPTGELSWDVVNDRGEKLASGVYIYLITDNSGNKAKGKFAVIR